MTDKKQISEEKTAAASYIITFYQNVSLLTYNYAIYLNLLTFQDDKYRLSKDKTFTDQEMQQIREICQNLRHNATTTYIQYMTIVKSLSLDPDPEISKAYTESIKKDFIIPQEAAEKYIMLMNGALMQHIVKDLLQRSQDLVSELYKNE
jgi:hypothetical protein